MIRVHFTLYDAFRISVRSFIHNAQFFVPKDLFTAIGLPFQIIEKAIFSLISPGDGFVPGSKSDAKWLANKSDFFPLRVFERRCSVLTFCF